MRLSILDQSPARQDGSAAAAIAETIALARECGRFVPRRLVALAERHGAKELVIVSITYDFESQLRSYELLAREFGIAL